MKLRNILNESTRNKLLFHGTHKRHLSDIKRNGLVPSIGDVVKSTESYQYYMDDEYMNPEYRVDGVVFLSESPDTWSYSHFGKQPNINEALLVVVKNNDTIYQKRGDYFYNINGIRVRSIDGIPEDSLPFFIESGDYFSLEPQVPVKLLHGMSLSKFIKNDKT